MPDYKEQWYAIKFMVKAQKKTVETYHELKKVYGDACMSKVTCLQWHAAFRKGRARGLQRTVCLKSFNVQKWEIRFILGLIDAKNTQYIKKSFK